jgi:hypothetical protein
VDERGRQVEPAAHPAGVGADATVGCSLQPHAAQERLGASLPLAAGQPVQGGLEADQLAAGHQRVERRLLERHADGPAHLRWVLDHVVTGDTRGSPGGSKQRAEHSHRGRLAGAVRAEEGVDLAGGHVQVHAVDRPHVPREDPLQRSDLDRRHGG